MGKKLYTIVSCFVLICFPAVSKVVYEAADDGWKVRADGYLFEYDTARGRWDLEWRDGKPAVRGAVSTADLRVGKEKVVLNSAGDAGRTVENHNFKDRIGEGVQVSVTHDGGRAAKLVQTFRFYERGDFLVTFVGVDAGAAGSVRRVSVLDAGAGEGGGVFVGDSPERAWILENGYNFTFDFWVRLVRGGTNSISDWNTAVHDPETGRTIVAGFVTGEAAQVQVNTFYREEDSVVDAATGWRGFSGLRAVEKYYPPKDFAAGDGAFRSELFFVGLSEDSPNAVLETFGDVSGGYYGCQPWRGDIPTGWNSWATKYHKDITQENMLENARRVAERLLPYGMTTFQIDDGWQVAEGDWEPNEKFPDGMGATAAQIRKMGLTPGLWLAPFVVGVNSRLAKDHPDWIAPKSPLGEALVPKDWLILDLSHPEVLNWLDALFNKVTREWGYKVIKIDFVYYALMGKAYHDPMVTNVEAYRKGLAAVRNALAEDAFLINVGVPLISSLGLVDSMRIGLDFTPNWGDDPGYGTQGLKPLVRNLARRYFLNHRVWINHPDMFYLGSPEEEQRWGSRLSLQDGKMYGTLVALIGGITKIGDSFVGLSAEQEALLVRLLPVHHGSARPLDLFEKEYPEVWHLEAVAGGEPYHVVALFNWGLNRRYGEQMEEKARTVGVDIDRLGAAPDGGYAAYEFWTDKYLGATGARLEMNVPPRDVRVVALRPKLSRPFFLSTNRHVVQGATDVVEMKWNGERAELTLLLDAVGGFDYSVKFHVPAGYDVERASVGGREAGFEFDGELLKVFFREAAGGRTEVKLKFRKERAEK
ncbi:MAG: alpha-galactosidase [bacterium]